MANESESELVNVEPLVVESLRESFLVLFGERLHEPPTVIEAAASRRQVTRARARELFSIFQRLNKTQSLPNIAGEAGCPA